MAKIATTINENGVRWQYAVPRRVVQRSSTLLVPQCIVGQHSITPVRLNLFADRPLPSNSD
jgi:hypothetical protein